MRISFDSNRRVPFSYMRLGLLVALLRRIPVSQELLRTGGPGVGTSSKVKPRKRFERVPLQNRPELANDLCEPRFE
jgi:hypothetical protein